jgi:hypothetical protein
MAVVAYRTSLRTASLLSYKATSAINPLPKIPDANHLSYPTTYFAPPIGSRGSSSSSNNSSSVWQNIPDVPRVKDVVGPGREVSEICDELVAARDGIRFPECEGGDAKDFLDVLHQN